MVQLLSVALLAAFLATSSTAAHPTGSASEAGAVRFEPLVRRLSSSHDRPARSIERLRLRKRKADLAAASNPSSSSSTLTKRVISNPKAAEALQKRSIAGSVTLNTDKAQKRSASAPVVYNPKAAKRDLRVAERLTKRGTIRRSIDLVTSSIDKVLSRRQTNSLLRIIPNPKSNNYAAVVSVLSSLQSPGATATSTFSSISSKVLGPSPSIVTIWTSVTSSILAPQPSSTSSVWTTTALPTSTATVPSWSANYSSTLASSTWSSDYSTATMWNSTATSMPLPTETSTSTPSSNGTATTNSTLPSYTGWPTSGGPIAGAYYADWTAGRIPPENVPYKMFDILHFSFAVPTTDLSLAWTGDSSGDLLTQTIALAHANNTKVLITIGGWADSGYFSTAVSTDYNRQTFAANIYSWVTQYGADGVDIDWEYPGTQGNAGNTVSPSDTANFLSFLQVLRGLFGPTLRITAAVTSRAFIGADGNPLTDVSAFAQVLDAIMVMNYDVWGASSNPGPNAPLSNLCPNSLQPTANMLSAIQTWSAAGMPANQILMGVPAYGYVSSSSATTLVHKRDLGRIEKRELVRPSRDEANMSPGHRLFVQAKKRAAKQAALARARKLAERKAVAKKLAKRDTIVFCPNNHSGKPCPGVTGQNITEINWYPLNGAGAGGNGTFGGVGGVKIGNGDVSSLDGNQIEFYQLVDYGVLSEVDDAYVGDNGYTRAWDACSTTPYAYSQARNVVITYDDPESMNAKGALAAAQSIAGMLVWELSGDTSDFQLAQAWRSGMGLTPLGV